MNEAKDRAEPDHSLGDAGERFMVDQQPTAEPPGSKGLLDTPPLWQQDKAFGEFWASDNLDSYAQSAQCHLEAPRVGAIRDHKQEPGEK